jgi:hypothetical protein
MCTFARFGAGHDVIVEPRPVYLRSGFDAVLPT